jgi:hypothetical protein
MSSLLLAWLESGGGGLMEGGVEVVDVDFFLGRRVWRRVCWRGFWFGGGDEPFE